MRRGWDLVNVLPRHGVRFPKFHGLDITRQAIDEVENNIQAPRDLIASTALSAISLAVQGLYDVSKPNGHISPCSIYSVVVADSGERKSGVASVFHKAIEDIQSEYSLTYKEKEKIWRGRCLAVDAQIRSVQKIIDKKTSRGECVENDLIRIVELEGERPIKPKKFKILYDDSTPEALFSGLNEDICTAGLISAEGGSVLQGRALRDLAKQNSIWSGESITVDRKTGDSFVLTGARLGMSVLVQESSLSKYLNSHGDFSRGVGFFARVLIFLPKSTQGERYIKNGTVSWEHCERFNHRLKELLRRNMILLEEPKFSRELLRFSPKASQLWIDVYNAIEYEIRIGGRFEGMGDYASKLSDNIARIAANLHVFEGLEGDISIDTLNCAIDICFRCSEDFEFIFMHPKQEVADAEELDRWFDRYRDRGEFDLPKNFVRQRCPNHLRNKERLDAALEELHLQRRICLYRKRKMQCVDLYAR